GLTANLLDVDATDWILFRGTGLDIEAAGLATAPNIDTPLLAILNSSSSTFNLQGISANGILVEESHDITVDLTGAILNVLDVVGADNSTFILKDVNHGRTDVTESLADFLKSVPSLPNGTVITVPVQQDSTGALFT